MASAVPNALAQFGNNRRPLDWANTAVALGQQVLQPIDGVIQQSGLLRPVTKDDLRSGDHVYAWKYGWTYSHHGIVVRTEACAPDCLHDTLSCCSIVHFQPPTGNTRGRIELVDLAGFVQGRNVCKCKYGVMPAEFYLTRSGCCATEKPDPWPLVIIRALSLLEFSSPDGAVGNSAAAQVEYNLLKKNSELLARWCMLGNASGVRRFLSNETAFSLQTAPGRFVRLGLAVAVTGAAVAGAAAAISASGAAASISGAATGAASSAAGTVSSTTGAAVTAAGEAAAIAGEAASTAAVAGEAAVATTAANPWFAAGTLAASAAARNLLMDIAQRPHEAVGLVSQVSRALPSSPLGQTQPSLQALLGIPLNNSVPRGLNEERRYQQEQQDTLVAAVGTCFRDLNAHVAKPLSPLLACPFGCSLLCEMLVDLLEREVPEDATECVAYIQSFLEGLYEF